MLVGHYARSSIASAFGESVVKDLWSDSLASDFQKRMVKADLQKTLPATLSQSAYDILLYDAIDERLHLFQFSDGSLCTILPELQAAGFDFRSAGGRVIQSGSEAFFKLWELGWIRFVRLLESLNRLSKLRINVVRWATRPPSGSSFSAQHTNESILAANTFLERLYSRMRDDIEVQQFLTFPEELMRAASVHRGGIGPFHYVDEYYHAAGRALQSGAGDWEQPPD
jgi:hypothetical protein